MDAVKSFKGYGKVDDVEQREFTKRTWRRFLVVTFLLIVLVGIVAAVAATVVHLRRKGSDDNGPASVPSSGLTPASSLRAVCSVTQYPDSCFSSISSLNAGNSTDPEQLFLLSLRIAADELSKVADLPIRLTAQAAGTIRDEVRAALTNVCLPVLQDAADTVIESISSLNSTGRVGKFLLNSSGIGDLRTWLSAAMTNQETCIEALTDINATELADSVRSATLNSTRFTSNSLAIVTKIIGLLAELNIPIHRRRLLTAGDYTGGQFPSWVGPGERRMMQGGAKPDVMVAKDGSGNYKTIAEAVAAAPVKSKSGRFVIYIKAGTYLENVDIGKHVWNVMMYGDGKTRTVVSGSLNFADGTPTFKTATFAVTGKGFMARDMGFFNTAGAAKHQAVALRSGSDLSVFYRCSFDGFQDTLYTHSNRQFYRECDITGTVDFIFGNSAVVFQNCNIRPRQPLENQFNAITAQGKTDLNQNTGISIQKCTIFANGNVTAPTYLGRPWKNCATTVIMQSNIGPLLNPKGWTEWVAGVNPPKTIFYGEYQNAGVGAGTAKRVSWAGYKAALTATEAGRFTVDSFIQGREWLPQTSVTYGTSL